MCETKIYDLLNDTYKELLWGHRYIKCENIFSKTREEELKIVKIAIIDSGLDINHEDFRCDYKGYNFVSDSNDITDSIGHGTRVTGVIAAEKNNGMGVAGIANGAQIFPLKVIDINGIALMSDIENALRWAIDNEMTLINISLNEETEVNNASERWFYNSQHGKIEGLLKEALDKDIILVAPIGNKKGGLMGFPAEFPGVVSVGSYGINIENYCVTFSDFNAQYEENTVFAPGEYIFTTDLSNSYLYDSGTSFACAYVTASLALLKAKAKDTTTSLEIKKLLVDASDTVEDQNRIFKIINVDKAYKIGVERGILYE